VAGFPGIVKSLEAIMGTSSHSLEPTLFISHKHSDSKIADAITAFITMCSGGRVAVFQSSSPWADSPKVGRNMNKQLREALWKTRVVILLYTTPNLDWSYCMWECGVASHPQSPETKIIVFQCTAHSPALFAEQVNVNIRNLVDVQKFTDEFLTAPDFFPGLEGPITKFQPHGKEVASAAAEFCQKLHPLLPPEKEDPSVEWPAYPFLQFELSLQDVERIQKVEAEARSELARDIIQKCSLVSGADRFGEQLFGVPSFPAGTNLSHLMIRWREKYPNTNSKWVEALCDQIMDGALWRFPALVCELMQGLNDSTWYAPVLNRVRKIPSRQCMQFDIYFYRRAAKVSGTGNNRSPARTKKGRRGRNGVPRANPRIGNE
jgi:hypothetical protein